MSRVYLDACSIIYLVEVTSPFHYAVVRRLLQFQSDPGAKLITRVFLFSSAVSVR